MLWLQSAVISHCPRQVGACWASCRRQRPFSTKVASLSASGGFAPWPLPLVTAGCSAPDPRFVTGSHSALAVPPHALPLLQSYFRHCSDVLCKFVWVSTVQIKFQIQLQTIVGGDIWAINVGDLTVLSQQFVVTVPGLLPFLSLFSVCKL